MNASTDFWPSTSRRDCDAWSVFFSLHELLFLCAHHKREPTQVDAWEGSKHRSLAEHINAEDPSYDITMGEISMNGPMA